MGKERLIPLLALLVLVLSSISTVYVYAIQSNSEVIDIQGQEYTIDQLFYLGDEQEIEDYAGAGLATIMKKIGIRNPEEHDYTIIGADGYQKTVQWEHLENGLLTKERQTIFSDLPKAFRVKDVVRIEVE